MSRSTTALSIAHQGQFPAVTFSFNLAPNTSLGDAVDGHPEMQNTTGPALHAFIASFQGTAQAFQDSLASEPYLILAALVTVYIVLGMLYENYIHPITILSTLPSAGVGALLALLLFHTAADRHRLDRHHPADRHRQEERHPDDRFRHPGRTQRR